MARTHRAGSSNPHFRPSRAQLFAQVTLDCGHTISTRQAPINNKARYGCSLGQGCGYQLRWTKYTENGTVVVNRDNPPKEREERSMSQIPGPAISLDKVQATAPGLVSFAKTAAVSLDKKGLTGQRAAVYLVLDHSASMSHHYEAGNVQRLAEQALGLSVNLDDDGVVPTVFFSNAAAAPSAVRLENYQGIIEHLHSQQRWGGTHYAAAMQAVISDYQSSGASDPALVIFQTDGNPQDQGRAESLLKDASKLPMFWSFVGFGDELTFLRKLDKLRVGFGGRKVDNASLFDTGRDPRNVSDSDLYDGIMHEYPDWLTAARKAGIIG